MKLRRLVCHGMWKTNASMSVTSQLTPANFVLSYIFPLTGVEHLLRDVKDTTISTLATEVLF